MFGTQKLLVWLSSNLQGPLYGPIGACILIFKQFQNFTKTCKFSILKAIDMFYGPVSMYINWKKI